MTAAQLSAEFERLCRELHATLRGQFNAAEEYAEAENRYRLAHARAYLAAEGPAHERKARADLVTGDERFRSRLADGRKQATLEAVRSLRAQISALQTVAGLAKAEAEFARTTP